MPTEALITETNVTAVRRFWVGFNAYDLDVWDTVCTAGIVNHDPGLPTPDAESVPGRSGPSVQRSFIRSTP
jgi:hypothetical protein